MRKFMAVPMTLLILFAAGDLSAQEGETWETQEPVYNVATIRIHPNMGERYLNNLKRTWVTGVEASMEEGLVEDYWVYSSVTPLDGGYNLMLVTRHPNLASLDATDAWRERIAAVDRKVLAEVSEEESDEITSTVYPEVRTILSEKLMREVRFMDGSAGN